MDKYHLRNKFVLPLLLLAISVFTPACREGGCTDPTAVNYNITADEDDGSCYYCSGGANTSDFTLNIVDSFPYSQFYDQAVAKFHFTQLSKEYSDPRCTDPGYCKIKFKLENIISQQINCYLMLHYNDTSFLLNSFVPPFESTLVAEIDISSGPCPQFNIDSISVEQIFIDYQ